MASGSSPGRNLAARTPIQTRIDTARRQIGRITHTSALDRYVGQAGLLRRAWPDLPINHAWGARRSSTGFGHDGRQGVVWGWNRAGLGDRARSHPREGPLQADIGDFDLMNNVYEKAFSAPYPARTTVQAGLGRGVLVEVDAIAHQPATTTRP